MSKSGVTTQDITLDLWGKKAVTIPKGTEVLLTKGGDWAVTSARLLSDLTGNMLDPYFKFVFVPENIVRKA